MTLTVDLDIYEGSRGCRGTRSCKILSCCVQRFMSYRGNGEKQLGDDAEKILLSLLVAVETSHVLNILFVVVFGVNSRLNSVFVFICLCQRCLKLCLV